MALDELIPGFGEILASIGEGGKRLADIDPAEGAAGNRSALWSKHGVMARSDISVTRAVDRIEYAETAARFEPMDLVDAERAEGLTPDEMRAVVEACDVRTTIVGAACSPR